MLLAYKKSKAQKIMEKYEKMEHPTCYKDIARWQRRNIKLKARFEYGMLKAKRRDDKMVFTFRNEDDKQNFLIYLCCNVEKEVEEQYILEVVKR